MAIDNLLLSRFHCSRWCFQITLKTSLAQWIIEYPIITQCFKILQKSKKTIIRNIFYYIIIEYKPNKRESFTRQWLERSSFMAQSDGLDLSRSKPTACGKRKRNDWFYLMLPSSIGFLTSFCFLPLHLLHMTFCIRRSLNVIESKHIKYNSIIKTNPSTQRYNCLFLVLFNCIDSENICYDFYLSPAVTSFQTRLDSYSACSTIGRTCFLNIGMRFTSTNTSVF